MPPTDAGVGEFDLSPEAMAVRNIAAAAPETIADLYAVELRQRRSRMVTSAAITAVLTGLLLFTWGEQISVQFAIFAALGALMTAATVWGFVLHRRLDPVAAARANTVVVSQAAIAARTAFRDRIAARPPRFTLAVAAAIIVIGVLQVVFAGSTDVSVAVAGLVKPQVTAGEWWRLLTATYLHASLFHLWANLSALLVLGRLMEVYAPRTRLALTYLLAGLSGNLASWQLLPHQASLGASGAIMGLAGFLIVLARRRPHDVPAAIGRNAIMTCILTGTLGLILFKYIDNFAHLGGVIAGALTAWFTVPREDTVPNPGRERALDIAGWMSAGVLAMAAAGTMVLLIRSGPASLAQSRPARSQIATSPQARVTAEIVKASVGNRILIQNNSGRTIEAYKLYVFSGDRAVTEEWRDDCCFSARDSHAPIRPYQAQLIPVDPPWNHAPSVSAVQLVVAVFDDLSFEGSREEFDNVIHRRQSVVNDATFWLATIDAAEAAPIGDVKALIQHAAMSRGRVSDTQRDVYELFNTPALRTAADGPPSFFLRQAEANKALITDIRGQLLTHLPR